MIKLLFYILLDERGGTLSMTRKTANTLATASGMNTNMDECEAVLNGHIDADNLEDDGVTAVKLNSDVVRTNYGLIQHTDGTLYVDVSDTTPCLEITDGGLRVKVDGTTITRGAGGLVASGVSDHGALTGLSDDDHAQYLNTTRHDADDHSSFNYATMGTGILPTAKVGVTESYAASGSVTIGTFILKWGYIAPGGAASQAVAFGTAFPNACYSAVLSMVSATDYDHNMYVASLSVTGFTAGYVANGAYWIAEVL